MIRKYLEKVLKGYQKAKKENFDGHQMVKLINNDFPNYLSQITPNADKYKFMSNSGKKTADKIWTCCPTIAILNSNVTTAIGKGYFVIYIFSQDTKRAYLSLNQGIQNFSRDEVKENASILRKKLGTIPNKFNLESIALGDPAFFGRYQMGNICARCYNLDNLPSEEELQSDYLEMLKLYDKISPQNEYLKIIEDRDEIKAAQEEFLKILHQKADEIISTEKFDLGPKMKIDAHWSNDLGIWVVNRELEHDRFFNAFGIHKPDANSNLSVACEINIQKDGLNRNVAGAFAKDLEGNVYLIHRGSIGGQKKQEFFDKYHGKTAQIQDGDIKTEAVVLGGLNDPKLPEHVRNFVFEVAKIKGLIIDEGMIKINKKPRIWKITPGDEEEYKIYWPLYKEKGYIGIDWMDSKYDFTEFDSIDNLKIQLEKFYGQNKPQAANMAWNFTHEIKEGDYIVANRGKNKILGIGMIKSDYIGPNDPKNPNLNKYYRHLRKVEWNKLEELSLNKPLFDIKTVTELDFNKCNEIIGFYGNKYPEYRDKFIKKIYNEFKVEYLETETGQNHLKSYETESKKFKNQFNKIRIKKENYEDLTDDILYGLVPHKGKSIVGFISDIKPYFAKKLNINPNSFPKIADALYNLIENLVENEDNIEKQRDSISNFIQDGYSKGFGTGIISPTFFFIDNHYPLINSKTKDTVKFLSKFYGKEIDLNTKLSDYIDNKEKLNNLLEYLTIIIPEFSNFAVFDIFCHWMREKDLGNYAMDYQKSFNSFMKDFSDNDKLLFNTFNDYLNHENFIYNPEMIENFLLSLKVKPFVILTGNSGTGKTKIAQLFAEYLQQKNEGNFLIIPVGANWTENRHLMGFYNVITSNYQSTPTLDLIIKARDDPSNPYFLILDEMNLSHVERYFSDFLSAIESGKEISLYSPENAEKIKNKNIPEKIKIPHNLFVVGTVNVDETTYMFSPKVLDRANTIEFKTYPAMDYIMCQIKPEIPKGEIDYLENPLSHEETRKSKINKLKTDMDKVTIQNGEDNLWELLALEIHSFQEVLSEADFDFGFRVIDEIMRFMYTAWLYEDSPEEWNNWQRYFDAQIMQKILPKIHGSQQELSQVLENLFELCYSGKSIDKIWYSANLEEYEIKYPSSAKKLQKMGKKLQEKRFVSFTD